MCCFPPLSLWPVVFPPCGVWLGLCVGRVIVIDPACRWPGDRPGAGTPESREHIRQRKLCSNARQKNRRGAAPKHRGGKHHTGGNSPQGNPTRQHLKSRRRGWRPLQRAAPGYELTRDSHRPQGRLPVASPTTVAATLLSTAAGRLRVCHSLDPPPVGGEGRGTLAPPVSFSQFDPGWTGSRAEEEELKLE